MQHDLADRDAVGLCAPAGASRQGSAVDGLARHATNLRGSSPWSVTVMAWVGRRRALIEGDRGRSSTVPVWPAQKAYRSRPMPRLKSPAFSSLALWLWHRRLAAPAQVFVVWVPGIAVWAVHCYIRLLTCCRHPSTETTWLKTGGHFRLHTARRLVRESISANVARLIASSFAEGIAILSRIYYKAVRREQIGAGMMEPSFQSRRRLRLTSTAHAHPGHFEE